MFTVLVLYLAVKQISIPKEIVPSRWSDFTFFSNLADEKTQAFAVLMNSQKTAPEAKYFHVFFQSLLFVGLSVGMYLLTILGWIKRDDGFTTNLQDNHSTGPGNMIE